jgi:hypothetical protein
MQDFKIKNWHIVCVVLFCIYILINTFTAQANLRELVNAIY